MLSCPIFNIDQLQSIWPEIEAHLVKEREQYNPLYDAIETYIREQNLVIGGTMGVNLLLGKARSLDDYVYEVYSEQSFLDANNLSNAMADAASPSNKIMLETILPYRRYKISVDGRPLVWVIDLGKETVSPLAVISPIQLKSGLYVLSPEMQLIDLYRTLYSPNKAGSWEAALHDETRLFKYITESHRLQAPAGGEDITPDLRGRIQRVLLEEYVSENKEVVLIGEYAAFLIAKTSVEAPFLHVVSARSVNDDVSMITKILAAHTSHPVTHTTRGLHIMQDYRLRRTVIKLGGEGKKQKEIMYIYNSAHYDLIPFNRLADSSSKRGFIQVGNPFVVLRFLLVDFWMLKWILESGGVDPQYGQHRLASIRSRAIALRRTLSADSSLSAEAPVSGPARFFQDEPDQYIGQYESEDIFRKSKQVEATHHRPYFPQDYMDTNGQYRSVNRGQKNNHANS